MNSQHIKRVCEAALMVADEPLDVDQLLALWQDEPDAPGRADVQQILAELISDYADRGIELKEVASGFRFQARSELAALVNRLFERRSPRYSRALMETLAVIAYRQPITRAEIEAIRGVAVNSNMVRMLMEREWIRVAGHRDIPGRPAVYATTREFLNYFNLRTLSELPDLAELRDIDSINADLFADQPIRVLDQADAPDLPVSIAAPQSAEYGPDEDLDSETRLMSATG